MNPGPGLRRDGDHSALRDGPIPVVRHRSSSPPARRSRNSLTTRRHIEILGYIDTTKSAVHKNYSRSIPRQWRDIAKVFVAMGDPHRQRILLTFERGERLNVGQIADVSTLSRSAVSHHLKIMREAGVLGSEKIGKEVYFWVERERCSARWAASATTCASTPEPTSRAPARDRRARPKHIEEGERR